MKHWADSAATPYSETQTRRLRVGWFIPTFGDSRSFGEGLYSMPASLDHSIAVARAAEAAGLEYALVPVTPHSFETWMASSWIAAHTSRLKLLIAARPSYMLPHLNARMIATLDHASNGRVMINLIAGANGAELRADGLWLDHDERYLAMDEMITLTKRLWAATEPVTFEGRFARVENAVCFPRPVQKPCPEFYLGGRSAEGKAVFAKHADVFLFWGEYPDVVAAETTEMRAAAATYGRENQIRFGMRLQLVLRETEAEAWRDAEALIEGAPDRTDRNLQKMDQSAAQRRMHQLTSAARVDGYRLGGALWAGIASVRPGAGIALVGAPDQILEALGSYVRAGCTEFIFSGYPHDREAYRVGALLLPRIRELEGYLPQSSGS